MFDSNTPRQAADFSILEADRLRLGPEEV